MVREALPKQAVVKVIERKGAAEAVPLLFHKWWGNGLEEKYGKALYDMAAQYPDDILIAPFITPGEDVSKTGNPDYRWGYRKDYTQAERHSIGEQCVLLPDWDELERFLESMPDPMEEGTFENTKKILEQRKGRYVVGHFWRLFHERFWSIRGMENLMMDYYDNMEGLQRIGQACLTFYKGILDRYAALGVDGIFTSDDLGHQTGPMMSPGIFRELYVPLYREFIGYAHKKGMHVFLHSCGDNSLLLPDLIEAGLDVFHPIQTGCMDLTGTAHKFGGKITFLAGFDVQHMLPQGTPEQIREQVKKMADILSRPEGGLMFAAGNGIMSDTPLENIQAMLDAMSKYGMKD